jgi:hypothetical protein
MRGASREGKASVLVGTVVRRGRAAMTRGPQGPPPFWLVMLVLVRLVLLAAYIAFPFLMGP